MPLETLCGRAPRGARATARWARGRADAERGEVDGPPSGASPRGRRADLRSERVARLVHRRVRAPRATRTHRAGGPRGGPRGTVRCARFARRCGERGIQSDCAAFGGLSSWPPCGSFTGPQLAVQRGPSLGRRREPSTPQPAVHEARHSGRDGSNPSQRTWTRSAGTVRLVFGV